MTSKALQEVKQKFVTLMRNDPPPSVMGLPTEPLAPVFDRWVAKRFSAEEVHCLFKLELEYGERAMTEWFAEVLVEAGMVRVQRLTH